MQRQVVLVIRLGGVERRQRDHLGDDLLRVALGGVELGDVLLGRFLLRRVGIEHRRAVLRAVVGVLAVQLRRIVHDREEDLQQRAVAHLLRVVGDLHRLGVAGEAAADQFVDGGLLGAAGIARHRLDDAVDALEDALHAPEATAREHRGLRAARAGRRVDRGRRDLHCRLGGARYLRRQRADQEGDGEAGEKGVTARRGEQGRRGTGHDRSVKCRLVCTRPPMITEIERRRRAAEARNRSRRGQRAVAQPGAVAAQRSLERFDRHLAQAR